MSFAIKKSDIPLIEKSIEKFQYDLLNNFSVGEDLDEVYSLTVSLFPQTQA